MIGMRHLIGDRLRRRQWARQWPTSVLHEGCVVSRDCVLGEHTVLFAGVQLESCSLGAYSYLQAGAVALDATIGPFCSIGARVTIGLAAHPMTMVSTSPVFYDPSQPLPRFLIDAAVERAPAQRTTIGADVWFGQGAMCKAGVDVGTGAVIGAGAIVTRDVEPYAIVAGNPARVIRHRFDPATVGALLASRWWSLDTGTLRRCSPLFRDPHALLAALERGL
jgi:acetyltransferase-like isoleucine patch superfamily enzyme